MTATGSQDKHRACRNHNMNLVMGFYTSTWFCSFGLFFLTTVYKWKGINSQIKTIMCCNNKQKLLRKWVVPNPFLICNTVVHLNKLCWRCHKVSQPASFHDLSTVRFFSYRKARQRQSQNSNYTVHQNHFSSLQSVNTSLICYIHHYFFYKKQLEHSCREILHSFVLFLFKGGVLRG